MNKGRRKAAEASRGAHYRQMKALTGCGANTLGAGGSKMNPEELAQHLILRRRSEQGSKNPSKRHEARFGTRRDNRVRAA